MSNYQNFINLVREMSGQKNTMTIPRIYIKIAGDITAGVFLSQLVWYSDKGTRKDGWFWKSNKEWKEEIELSYAQVKRCARDLEARGFIETKIMRAKGAPTTHYKVDMDKIIMAMIELVSTATPILEKVENQGSQKSNLEKVENESLEKVEKHEQHQPNIDNNNMPNGTNGLPELTPHEQDELLVYGLYGHNGSHPEPESLKEKIIDSGWHVRSPIILQALIDFLEACQEVDHPLAIPNSDLRRKDWHKNLKGHTEDFEPGTLKQRYISVLKRAKAEGWINKVSRPGSLDKSLPTADMSQANGKSHDSDVADYTQDKQYQFFAELDND